ncbi:MAG: hypothetical protein V7638_3863 [Acidobacteriota bacterium]|jgi:hypothetical protein
MKSEWFQDEAKKTLPEDAAWSPTDHKGGFATATLTLRLLPDGNSWVGLINEQKSATFTLAMPYLGDVSRGIGKELGYLRVFHHADGTRTPWKVVECVHWKVEPEKGEIFVAVRVEPVTGETQADDPYKPTLVRRSALLNGFWDAEAPLRELSELNARDWFSYVHERSALFEVEAAQSLETLLNFHAVHATKPDFPIVEEDNIIELDSAASSLRIQAKLPLQLVEEWRPDDDGVAEVMVSATIAYRSRNFRNQWRGRINEQPSDSDFEVYEVNGEWCIAPGYSEIVPSTRWALGHFIYFSKVKDQPIYDTAFSLVRRDGCEKAQVFGKCEKLIPPPAGEVREMPGIFTFEAWGQMKDEATLFDGKDRSMYDDARCRVDPDRVSMAVVPGGPAGSVFSGQATFQLAKPAPRADISFRLANGFAYQFALDGSKSLSYHLIAFAEWLPTSGCTQAEAGRFMAEFIKAVLSVQERDYARRVERTMDRVGHLLPTLNAHSLIEAVLLTEFADMYALTTMDAQPTVSQGSSDRVLAMRNAAANVIQGRIDTQKSYAKRGQEQKDRLTIMQAIKEQIEKIDPEGLE